MTQKTLKISRLVLRMETLKLTLPIYFNHQNAWKVWLSLLQQSCLLAAAARTFSHMLDLVIGQFYLHVIVIIAIMIMIIKIMIIMIMIMITKIMLAATARTFSHIICQFYLHIIVIVNYDDDDDHIYPHYRNHRHDHHHQDHVVQVRVFTLQSSQCLDSPPISTHFQVAC